jgi:hypothetical protein
MREPFVFAGVFVVKDYLPTSAPISGVARKWFSNDCHRRFTSCSLGWIALLMVLE